MTRGPRAYRLDTTSPAESGKERGEFEAFSHNDVVIADDPSPIDENEPTAPPRIKRSRWATLFSSALAALISMAIGLWVDNLIRSLFAISPIIGWIAAAIAAIGLVALLAMIGQEIAGTLRERKIERLRMSAVDAIAIKDHQAAKDIAAEVSNLYSSGNPGAIERLRALQNDIIDADDRLAIAERDCLAPLDDRAKRLVASAAKRVSVVTAVSPRAVVDIVFVLITIFKLLRQLANLYGGRPGLFGFMRLFRLAVAHLAVTGGVAVGDSLMHDFLGAGLAARLSAKLGEGVLNGAMTARFGIAAIAVCRPLPYIRLQPPKIGEVAGELLSKGEPSTQSTKPGNPN